MSLSVYSVFQVKLAAKGNHTSRVILIAASLHEHAAVAGDVRSPADRMCEIIARRGY